MTSKDGDKATVTPISKDADWPCCAKLLTMLHDGRAMTDGM